MCSLEEAGTFWHQRVGARCSLLVIDRLIARLDKGAHAMLLPVRILVARQRALADHTAVTAWHPWQPGAVFTDKRSHLPFPSPALVLVGHGRARY